MRKSAIIFIFLILLLTTSCKDGSVKIYTVSREVGSRKIVCYGIVESDDNGQAYVMAEVSESDIRYISVGQKVVVSGSGFDRSEYSGEITDTDSAAEHTQNGSFVACRVKIAEPDSSILDGFTARIEADVSLKDYVVIPVTAIGYENEGYYVEMISNGERIKTKISDVACTGSNMSVCKGIKSGDRIIEDLN